MDDRSSPVLTAALDHNLIHALTFRPYFNQEIRRWNIKFPYERSYLERVVAYLDGLPSLRFDALFSGVREVEGRMKIDPRALSSQEQTIEGSAILARSPHYLAWRSGGGQQGLLRDPRIGTEGRPGSPLKDQPFAVADLPRRTTARRELSAR